MDFHTETFALFDAANYLNSVEDIVAYLEASIDESDDDPQVIAQNSGMSREGLYEELSADANPSLATIVKVSHALGLRLCFEGKSLP